MLGLKLNHVSKRGHWFISSFLWRQRHLRIPGILGFDESSAIDLNGLGMFPCHKSAVTEGAWRPSYNINKICKRSLGTEPVMMLYFHTLSLSFVLVQGTAYTGGLFNYNYLKNTKSIHIYIYIYDINMRTVGPDATYNDLYSQSSLWLEYCETNCKNSFFIVWGTRGITSQFYELSHNAECLRFPSQWQR